MNILITGAGGFIGKHLSNLLVKEYKLFKIYSSSNSGSNNNSYTVDLTDGKAVKDLTNILIKNKINIIIHLASKMASHDKINDLDILRKNIAIVENMALLAKMVEPEILINFSSMAVYPNVSGLFSEDSLLNPQKNPDCIYGLSKYCSEVIFDFLLRGKNIRIAHLRVAQVYGDGMRKDRIIPVMRKELKKHNTITVFGNGERESNFIEIKKLAEIVEFFIKNEVSGIYNIGGNNLSYYDLAKTTIEQYGNKESRILKQPHGNKEKFNLDLSKFLEIMNEK